MCEELESPQWRRHLLTEAHMARSSLTDVEKEVLQRPALAFTDSDILANSLCSEKGMPTHLQVEDPLTKTMEKEILAAVFNCCASQSVAKKTYGYPDASGNP